MRVLRLGGAKVAKAYRGDSARGTPAALLVDGPANHCCRFVIGHTSSFRGRLWLSLYGHPRPNLQQRAPSREGCLAGGVPSVCCEAELQLLAWPCCHRNRRRARAVPGCALDYQGGKGEMFAQQATRNHPARDLDAACAPFAMRDVLHRQHQKRANTIAFENQVLSHL
jgi:hypothetical protein